ncbi:hypothetical protein ASZ78_013502 [Callipepla squamata]|uniref:Teneurin N-terminal domain-containing protein n=1 Tax=Callipepla squamata TaxID=9009 RepID=A0A226MYD2_CALSU|nr:hypothetical protein ASZ78_013502 [Callipepla squamata]
MDVKERKPYRSLTRRRDTERRYTSSSAESEDSKAPQKSYSSSETLKAYDQDSRLTYSNRVKDMVHQEADEFCRADSPKTALKNYNNYSGLPMPNFHWHKVMKGLHLMVLLRLMPIETKTY